MEDTHESFYGPSLEGDTHWLHPQFFARTSKCEGNWPLESSVYSGRGNMFGERILPLPECHVENILIS